MGRIAAGLAVGCMLGGQALAGGPVDDGAVARQLASPDPQVREAALIDAVTHPDVAAARRIASALRMDIAGPRYQTGGTSTPRNRSGSRSVGTAFPSGGRRIGAASPSGGRGGAKNSDALSTR